jgi:hypothetical protein
MEITHEDRLKFLKAHNDLRNTLMTIHECHDIWLSDVDKLERLECLMHSVMKFVPQQDDEGRSMHYADWVLAEEDDDDV